MGRLGGVVSLFLVLLSAFFLVVGIWAAWDRFFGATAVLGVVATTPTVSGRNQHDCTWVYHVDFEVDGRKERHPFYIYPSDRRRGEMGCKVAPLMPLGTLIRGYKKGGVIQEMGDVWSHLIVFAGLAGACAYGSLAALRAHRKHLNEAAGP